jgi:hypothetical protein
MMKSGVDFVEKRPYDLVSNRYLSDHEARDAVDREVARRAAADRYWQTRDFNPLTSSFYDGEKVRARCGGVCVRGAREV